MKKTAVSAQPTFLVTLSRERGAPAKPNRAELARLFAKAWDLVPAARRPELSGCGVVAVDVYLRGDAHMAEMNWAHMHHRGATDVISFPMGEFDPERGAFSAGEIVAGFETAAREAAARKLPEAEELARYCVHGFLHLLGYEDRTAAQRKALFAVQEAALTTTQLDMAPKKRATSA